MRQGCIPGGTNITLSSDSFLVAVFSCYYYRVIKPCIPTAPRAQWMMKWVMNKKVTAKSLENPASVLNFILLHTRYFIHTLCFYLSEKFSIAPTGKKSQSIGMCVFDKFATKQQLFSSMCNGWKKVVCVCVCIYFDFCLLVSHMINNWSLFLYDTITHVYLALLFCQYLRCEIPSIVVWTMSIILLPVPGSWMSTPRDKGAYNTHTYTHVATSLMLFKYLEWLVKMDSTGLHKGHFVVSICDLQSHWKTWLLFICRDLH